jgi:osmoprotectant transport system permease protein
MKFIVLFFAVCFSALTASADTIVVGSKIFTEGYILGEVAAQIIENSSATPVSRKLGMGSTGLLFEALHSGAIDVYPDYSGTLAETILKNPSLKSLEQISAALSPLGLTISKSLGFDNTYALAIKNSFAEAHHLQTISDLVQIAPQIRAAFSYEFMDRKDGYPGLVEHYKIPFDSSKMNRMEHSLVYQAINTNAVDMIEVYSTDANIKRFDLRLLKDDKGYFPIYQAVWVARKSFVENHPAEWQSLRKFEGTINEALMSSMNAQADIQKDSFAKIASGFLGTQSVHSETRYDQVLQRTKEHLWLVGLSLLFSILIGIPLGIMAARFSAAGQFILLFSGTIQTIPALALLCFLIPAFGVGTKPALVALCLYSLLPVVLNTFTGIRALDPKHFENAKAFGLSRFQILRRLTLPMASPTILAGVKTGTIVSIGTATLAALVGAGGYGALIITGLSLNDIPLILMGAIPAAAMALIAHLCFAVAEVLVVSKGLRQR